MTRQYDQSATQISILPEEDRTSKTYDMNDGSQVVPSSHSQMSCDQNITIHPDPMTEERRKK
eukprot:scaffold8588_cov72-Skeletonema_dohrnii-CCMP3373.AAC.3